MKCPHCSNTVHYGADICPQCGGDLKPLNTLEKLRHKVADSQRSVTLTLNELQQSIDDAEQALRISLSAVKPVSQPPPLPNTEEPSRQDSPPIASIPPPLTPVTPPVLQRPKTPAAEINIGQRWLLIAGVVITVICVGLFLKYAFENNWIGPAARVGMSYLAGFTFLGLGELFRRKKFTGFGLTLIGGGVAVSYASTYAAFAMYQLIGQTTAFGVMTVITVFAGALALLHDNKWLAVVGLLGGFLTPILVSTGANNYYALFTYITILNLGVAWLALRKQWKLLNWLGFIFTWLLYAGWHFRFYQDSLFWPAIVYLNIFFLVYALVPYLYYFRNELNTRVDSFTISILNSFIAFGFTYGMIGEHTDLPAASLVSVLYAGVFLALGQRLYKLNPENKRGFILSLAMAMLFLVITVPILFSGHWITVFWMAEAAVILWAAIKLGSVKLRWSAIALLLFALGKLVCYDYSELFGYNWLEFSFEPHYSTSIISRLVVVIVSLLALGTTARLLRQRFVTLSNFFIVLGGLLLFFVLNAEVGAFFAETLNNARAASISVLWALFAVALIIIGFAKNSAAARITAISLFGITALKVLVVDMANVSTPFRIISCGVLGILLIAASFLYYRYRDLLMPKDEIQNEEPRS